MFANLNIWEIGALALLGLFIFGPERLPKVISDGVRMLRTVRDMARNATADLSRELGTDVRLEDLHPKTFIRKHLLSEEDEQALRRPFDDAYRDIKGVATDVTDVSSGRPGLPAARDAQSQLDKAGGYGARPTEGPPGGYEGQQRPSDQPGTSRYDSDAT